jgi:predicted ATP-grasp superfamily ATP-dependent carboligase
MLGAIVEDLSRIAGVRIDTTWDIRLGKPPFSHAAVVSVESPAGELRHFQRLAAECDATLVIAPEFDDILSQRCRIVENSGGRLLGPGSRAVSLCTDKWRLAKHLCEAGVESIPAQVLNWQSAADEAGGRAAIRFPAVVKLREGAGSQNVHLVKNADELDALHRALGCTAADERFIWQPFIAGIAASVALLFSPSGRDVQVLPPAAQHLSGDGRFKYLGGRVPLLEIDRTAVQSAALAACRSVPGMRGYVGVDLVLPNDALHRPAVVEINPRLTTSYLGYRALAENNLAEWMLLPGRFERGVSWRDAVVAFDAAGTITT